MKTFLIFCSWLFCFFQPGSAQFRGNVNFKVNTTFTGVFNLPDKVLLNLGNMDSSLKRDYDLVPVRSAFLPQDKALFLNQAVSCISGFDADSLPGQWTQLVDQRQRFGIRIFWIHGVQARAVQVLAANGLGCLVRMRRRPLGSSPDIAAPAQAVDAFGNMVTQSASAPSPRREASCAWYYNVILGYAPLEIPGGLQLTREQEKEYTVLYFYDHTAVILKAGDILTNRYYPMIPIKDNHQQSLQKNESFISDAYLLVPWNISSKTLKELFKWSYEEMALNYQMPLLQEIAPAP